MNEIITTDIAKGQPLGSDLQDEVVDIKPFEGKPHFDMSTASELGAQDDDTDPEESELEDDDA